VQGDLQHALSFVADHAVELTAAGRTDAGVHALAQVAHFDTTASRTERSWVLGANSESRGDVRVLWARVVGDEFHARYSALSRTYRYLILDDPVRLSLDRHRACWSRRALDAGGCTRRRRRSLASTISRRSAPQNVSRGRRFAGSFRSRSRVVARR
jgi:tRNA pseudouridine38-40 synthase